MKKVQIYTVIILFLLFINSINAQTKFTPLKVEPENAILKDSVKREISTGVVNLSTLGRESDYLLSAKGFDPLHLRLRKGNYSKSQFELLSECEPCLISLPGSPAIKGIENEAKFILRKKIQEPRQTIMLGILPVKIDIEPSTVVAIINNKKITAGSKDIRLTMGFSQNFIRPIANGLSNNSIIPFDTENVIKDKTLLYRPKLLVKPVITKLEYRLDGRLVRDYIGPEYIECEWQFFTTNNIMSSVGSIKTKTTLFRTAPDLDLPVHTLLYEAARDLLTTDTLYSFLTRIEKNYLFNAKSEVTKLNPITESQFSSQKDMLRKLSSAVVTIENEEGFGSGIMIDPSGIILTNHHVIIDDTASLMVRVNESEDLIPAKVKVLNSDFDLALIQIPAGNYTALKLDTTDNLEVGDIVYAIGTPIDRLLGQSVSKGIVSGFRTVNGVNFIQTDVSINTGNSGGALISESGKLMGIATMKASGRGIEGLGFGIPSRTVVNALQLVYQ